MKTAVRLEEGWQGGEGGREGTRGTMHMQGGDILFLKLALDEEVLQHQVV